MLSDTGIYLACLVRQNSLTLLEETSFCLQRTQDWASAGQVSGSFFIPKYLCNFEFFIYLLECWSPLSAKKVL